MQLINTYNLVLINLKKKPKISINSPLKNKINNYKIALLIKKISSLRISEHINTHINNLAEFKANVLETKYSKYAPKCVFENESIFNDDNLGHKSMLSNNVRIFKLLFMFGLLNKKIVFLSASTKIVKICDIVNLYLSNLNIEAKYAKKNIAHLKKNRLKKRLRRVLPRKTTCIISIFDKKQKSSKISRLNKTIYNIDILPESSKDAIKYASSLFFCKYLVFFYKLGLNLFLQKKLNKIMYNVISH